MDGREQQQVTVDGMRIQFEEQGAGRPLICIHGGGPGASSPSTFARNVDALARSYRVILLDLPRFGGSQKVVTAEPRLSLYGRAIAGVVEQLGLTSVAFIGNSMGGQAAMRFAIDAPDTVRAIVAIGSTPLSGGGVGPTPPEGVRLLNEFYRGTGPSIEKMAQLMRTLVFDPSTVTSEMVEARYRAATSDEILEMHRVGNPAPAVDWLDSELAHLAAPMLFIWGSEDRAGQIDVGLRMVRMLPDAQMHVFSRCGHWAQFEHPEEFNRVVLDFLAAKYPSKEQ